MFRNSTYSVLVLMCASASPSASLVSRADEDQLCRQRFAIVQKSTVDYIGGLEGEAVAEKFVFPVGRSDVAYEYQRADRTSYSSAYARRHRWATPEGFGVVVALRLNGAAPLPTDSLDDSRKAAARRVHIQWVVRVVKKRATKARTMRLPGALFNHFEHDGLVPLADAGSRRARKDLRAAGAMVVYFTYVTRVSRVDLWDASGKVVVSKLGRDREQDVRPGKDIYWPDANCFPTLPEEVKLISTRSQASKD